MLYEIHDKDIWQIDYHWCSFPNTTIYKDGFTSKIIPELYLSSNIPFSRYCNRKCTEVKHMGNFPISNTAVNFFFSESMHQLIWKTYWCILMREDFKLCGTFILSYLINHALNKLFINVFWNKQYASIIVEFEDVYFGKIFVVRQICKKNWLIISDIYFTKTKKKKMHKIFDLFQM